MGSCGRAHARRASRTGLQVSGTGPGGGVVPRMSLGRWRWPEPTLFCPGQSPVDAGRSFELRPAPEFDWARWIRVRGDFGRRVGIHDCFQWWWPIGVTASWQVPRNAWRPPHVAWARGSRAVGDPLHPELDSKEPRLVLVHASAICDVHVPHLEPVATTHGHLRPTLRRGPGPCLPAPAPQSSNLAPCGTAGPAATAASRSAAAS